MKKILLLCLILLLIVPAAEAVDLDSLTFGGQVRMRGYKLNNFFDFNDEGDKDNFEVFRHKTSLWTKVDTGNDVSGFIQITNQNYGEGVTYPSNSSTGDGWEVDNKSNKVFVDQAYINVDNFFDQPVTLKIGRQNLMYGSGFILFDGQSQMASTSLYFDGVKVSLKLGENAVLDGLYFKDQENERDEEGRDDITLSGAYLTAHCPVIGGQQEIYVLNLLDEGLDTVFTPDDEKDIWMVGLRLSDKYDCGLDYSAEIAYQDGNFEGSRDHEALGYKLDAGFTLKDVAPTPRLFVGYASLSGDDPDTEENEAWDIFYGGWPQFGDLLAWKYVNMEYNRQAIEKYLLDEGVLPEGATLPPINSISDYDPYYGLRGTTSEEAIFSNINIASAGIGLQLTNALSTQFSYSLLTVDEPDYIDENGELVENDDDFGDYYQFKLNYKYSPNLSFSAYLAMIEPGDAFVNDDDAYEAFWETKLTF